MTHTIEDKTALIELAKRLREQAGTIEAALGRSVDCEEVMELVTGARATLTDLAAEVGEDHDEVHAARGKAA